MSENIMYKNIADKMKETNKEIEELKVENERLKETSINEILKNDFDLCVKDLKKAEKKIQKLEDYKSRCEKAVEYIGEYKDYCDKEVCDCTPEYFEDLLNILNGRSDE